MYCATHETHLKKPRGQSPPGPPTPRPGGLCPLGFFRWVAVTIGTFDHFDHFKVYRFCYSVMVMKYY